MPEQINSGGQVPKKRLKLGNAVKNKAGKMKRWVVKESGSLGKQLLKMIATWERKHPFYRKLHSFKITIHEWMLSAQNINKVTVKNRGRSDRIENDALSALLQQSPTSEDSIQRTITALTKGKNEGAGSNSDAINERLKVLESRKNILSGFSNNGRDLKVLQAQVALNFAEGSKAGNKLKEELKVELDSLKIDSSNPYPLSKGSIKDLKRYMIVLLRGMQKKGIYVRVKKFKKSVVNELSSRRWETIEKKGFVCSNGRAYSFRQECIPACKISAMGRTSGKTAIQSEERDVFPESYNGKGVVSHAITETRHASNLFISRLSSEAEKEEHLTIVRHAINSAYGLKPGKDRESAALNRGREVITAALAAKPELLREALENALEKKAVDLDVTSTSLVTPDIFRQIVRPRGDEKNMLQDQLKAFKTLSDQQPVTIEIMRADGVKAEVRVNLNLILFNFGVNYYAVDTSLDALGGWSESDKVNKEGIQQLIGNFTKDNQVGGMAGKWLAKQTFSPGSTKSAAKVRIVGELASQIRDIYQSGAHRNQQGGAYKLTSRIIVLTALIGGVPCTNCKSGKDRTSMSVASSEALHTYIRLHEAVPAWNKVNKDEALLVKEFCLQGGHHEIQGRNVGVPGFRIGKEILRGYGMDDSDIALVRGLADTVSS